MRKLLSIALILASLTACAQDEKKGDEPKKSPPKKPEITLKLGDPAPAIKVDAWLRGDEVKKFEKGKIYVMEFWATWCGPCIVMMPHLSELQQQYKDKGVVIIGFSAKDPNNTREKVEEFIQKRGKSLKYTFAYADDRETNENWMRAAGRNGIPCTFVVDKDGKIAYIGHPMYLDVVLPHVVTGQWNAEKDAKQVDEIEKEVSATFMAIGNADPEVGLKALKEFETKYPAMSNVPYFQSPKLRLLIKDNQIADAKSFATKLIEKAFKNGDNSLLGGMALALIGPDTKDAELKQMSLDAATKLITLTGDKEFQALMVLARAQYANDKKDDARKTAEKVLELAPERSRDAIKRSLGEILGKDGGGNDKK